MENINVDKTVDNEVTESTRKKVAAIVGVTAISLAGIAIGVSLIRKNKAQSEGSDTNYGTSSIQ